MVKHIYMLKSEFHQWLVHLYVPCCCGVRKLEKLDSIVHLISMASPETGRFSTVYERGSSLEGWKKDGKSQVTHLK